MNLIPRSLNRFQTGLVVLLTVACSSFGQKGATPLVIQSGDAPAQSPLEIGFKKSQRLGAKKAEASCGVPEGRQRIYDPKTGIFHIHFNPRNLAVSAFEVTKVGERFTKPVVFRLTGVPQGYGCLGVPLALSVGEKRYALEEGAHAPGPVDKGLFRVERKDDVVTVEFTGKGQALLKPGAQISFKVDTGW